MTLTLTGLFNDEEIAERIMQTKVPGKHKALGRKARGFNPMTWNERRTDIVREANRAKVYV